MAVSSLTELLSLLTLQTEHDLWDHLKRAEWPHGDLDTNQMTFFLTFVLSNPQGHLPNFFLRDTTSAADTWMQVLQNKLSFEAVLWRWMLSNKLTAHVLETNSLYMKHKFPNFYWKCKQNNGTFFVIADKVQRVRLVPSVCYSVHYPITWGCWQCLATACSSSGP